MKIVHIVKIFAGVMLLAAIGSITITIWASRQSEFHNERITLAHASYEDHLRLTADTYLLFKRFGDFLLAGDTERMADLGDITERLETHIANIRRTIEAEIRLVGAEEEEELELLAEIEETINNLVRLFELTMAREDAGDARTNWRELSLVLNDNIKNDFRSLISVALDEEAEEVAETDAEVRAETAMVRKVAVGLAALCLAVTGLALALIRKEFTLPFQRLLGGVRQLAAGEFSTKIERRGRSELSEIAGVLNEMSEMVVARTQALTLQNEKLEQAVNQRTETLQKLLAEARKSEKNRRQLLADVSHELRTPLTIIKGESDIALRGGDKSIDDYKEALRRTRAAAGHTANLVSDLLFIARSEAGSLRLRREPSNLANVIKDAIKLSGTAAQFDPPLEEIVANVDVHRMRQAILALLENARHHGGKRIQVSLSAVGGDVEVSVSDDGPGMSAEDKEQAFDRFFRGANAANRYTEGLGLGLPIVRSIAQAHGGSARIDDRDPQGTVVRFKLTSSS